jgi:hypothetical protein
MAQALFANQREANLHSTIALIEEVLGALGYPATQSRTHDASSLHAWQIAHIRVTANVMTIDAAVDRAALFAHLLELNAELAGVAFAAVGDRVLVVCERSTLDIDRSEVQDLIVHVTTTADDHDDALVARFGGRIGS